MCLVLLLIDCLPFFSTVLNKKKVWPFSKTSFINVKNPPFGTPNSFYFVNFFRGIFKITTTEPYPIARTGGQTQIDSESANQIN